MIVSACLIKILTKLRSGLRTVFYFCLVKFTENVCLHIALLSFGWGVVQKKADIFISAILIKTPFIISPLCAFGMIETRFQKIQNSLSLRGTISCRMDT